MALTSLLLGLAAPWILAVAEGAAPATPPSVHLAWGDLDVDGLADVLAMAPDGGARLRVSAGEASLGGPYPEELRRILVENGALDPDSTPDEATAAAQGWELREPTERDLPMLEAAGLLPVGHVSGSAAPDAVEVEAAEPATGPRPAARRPQVPGDRVPVPPPAQGGGA